MKMVRMQHPTFRDEPHHVGGVTYQIDAAGTMLVSEEHACMLEQGRWIRVGVEDAPVPGRLFSIPRTLVDLRQIIRNMGLKAVDILSLGKEMEQEEGYGGKDRGVPLEAPAKPLDAPAKPAAAPVPAPVEMWSAFGDDMPSDVPADPDPAPVAEEPEPEPEISVSSDMTLDELREIAEKLGVPYHHKTGRKRLYDAIVAAAA